MRQTRRRLTGLATAERTPAGWVRPVRYALRPASARSSANPRPLAGSRQPARPFAHVGPTAARATNHRAASPGSRPRKSRRYRAAARSDRLWGRRPARSKATGRYKRTSRTTRRGCRPNPMRSSAGVGRWKAWPSRLRVAHGRCPDKRHSVVPSTALCTRVAKRWDAKRFGHDNATYCGVRGIT